LGAVVFGTKFGFIGNRLHKTMTMTLRYVHLTREHKKKAVNLLNGLTASKKSDCHKIATFPDQEKSARM
jgi:hypothetical protein